MGEPVAAIAAIDLETAKKAAGLIEISYDELPAVFTPEEATAEGAPILHENFSDYIKIFEAESAPNTMAIIEIV